MSDFDAEAERKRLREKYDAEEESRKQTQQMSELLLKGATMTNRHCGECGSPIFQYEDQEFCPSCQRTVGAGAAENGPESTSAATGDTVGGSDGPTGADTTEVTAESDSGESTPETAGLAPETGAESAPETPSPGDMTAANGVDTADTVGDYRESHDSQGPSGAAAGAPTNAASESTVGNDDTAPTRRGARESLLAALTRHAQRAADTDEPQRATDHLEAARTAAAALNELDGS